VSPTSPAAAQPPARTAAIWAALSPVVDAGAPLRVLDVGGGSGMFAVPLAQLGHDVTVVDPSADALATLHRRADTAGVALRVHGLQGDGDRMHAVLDGSQATGDGPVPVESRFDLVLCHSVLEVVDDPVSTLREMADVLRPGGQLSIATANRAGAVLARAVSGHPVEARALLDDTDPAPGRARPVRRRFSPPELLDLVTGAGLQPGEWRGVSVVADLLSASSGADPAAVRSLELALAGASPYRDVATGLHVLATRPLG
jgi:S-adenosylmethionine-dependent methyltransferase